MQEAKTTRQHRALWGLAILGLIGLMVAIGFDIARRAGAMRPATTTAASVLSAGPRARIKVVVALENSSGNTYGAQILESRDASHYRPTPAHLRIALAADTKVVMGSALDLKPGAIVQADGEMDGSGTLHAHQIVILTGYVQVLPDR
jgi:hypothetical protein